MNHRVATCSLDGDHVVVSICLFGFVTFLFDLLILWVANQNDFKSHVTELTRHLEQSADARKYN
jgi:hypothetical protein